MPSNSLRITEVFHSLQGESSFAGLPTVFIRLTGCPLRCVYCDTAYAFEGGKKWDIADIIAEVAKYPVAYVCVTGGEPLAQPNCIRLLEQLIQKGYQVSLETSGAMPIGDVDPSVVRVLDLKTPVSQEQHRNLWENIPLLKQKDQVKFVISDPQDMAWALSKTIQYNLIDRVSDVLFSPVHDSYALDDFANAILKSGLNIRMQLQQHKYVWGDARGK